MPLASYLFDFNSSNDRQESKLFSYIDMRFTRHEQVCLMRL